LAKPRSRKLFPGFWYCVCHGNSTSGCFKRCTAPYSQQGDFANRVDALSDAQVKSEVMGVVRSMFPNVTVPELLDFYFPRWHSNPLFRGSYSNWPASFTSQHMDNLRANVGRLYFGGEGTSRKYFGKSAILCVSRTISHRGATRFPAWCLLRRTKYGANHRRLHQKHHMPPFKAIRSSDKLYLVRAQLIYTLIHVILYYSVLCASRRRPTGVKAKSIDFPGPIQHA